MNVCICMYLCNVSASVCKTCTTVRQMACYFFKNCAHFSLWCVCVCVCVCVRACTLKFQRRLLGPSGRTTDERWLLRIDVARQTQVPYTLMNNYAPRMVHRDGTNFDSVIRLFVAMVKYTKLEKLLCFRGQKQLDLHGLTEISQQRRRQDQTNKRGTTDVR